LLGLLGLLARPTAGLLAFRGTTVDNTSGPRLAALRNADIGFVFQSFHLLEHLSAIANVELSLIYAGVPRRRRHDRALAALESVGLADRAKHLPNQLSGGEQQRVAIARATVNGPAVLLADEPTGALDSATGADVLALFAALNRGGTTLVVVTHNAEVAAAASRTLSLVDGCIAGCTNSEEH
jgi:putative ABC transport system ATP-binding protein